MAASHTARRWRRGENGDADASSAELFAYLPRGLHRGDCLRSLRGMCLAVPGKLVEVTGDDPTWRVGKVDFGGILKEVNLGCVPDAAVGDYVLVHVGLAISKVDEDEALKVFEYLREMEELGEIELAGEEGAA